MCLHEAGFRQAPVVPFRKEQFIYVVGDSISAGIRHEKRVWPEILKEEHQLQVINLAAAGATVETAFDQARLIEQPKCIVIVEIGGNDFLGSTTSKQFSGSLDHLLTALESRGHTVVMFELPLLPFHNGFGKAQRELAAKHHAILVPKTYFAKILGGSGNTIDGLHLSQSGHEAMAAMVYGIFGLHGGGT
jgi:acyl-CoA thioesterase-1